MHTNGVGKYEIILKTKTALKFSSTKILSERLQLVPISESYNEHIFRDFTDDITRYMFPATPSNIEQVNSFIQASQDGMDRQTDLVLVITLNDTGEFLGVCGLHEKENPEQPELGVWLKKAAHGSHYGREAICSLVEWARNNLSLSHMAYPVDRDNTPSRKIAEYLGGVIIHEGSKKSMSGTMLNEVVYKILA